MYKIHSDDEMFSYLKSLGHNEGDLFSIYMSTGFLIWTGIKNILKQSGRPLSALTSVLDLPSGYGRVTRFMRQDLPPELITVCDIYSNAVHFLTKELDVKGIVSEKNPADITISDSFSAIFSISLFSHLPRHLFEQWLSKLIGLCALRGLLIFSTHSTDLLGNESPGEDFIFREDSESKTLESEIYGSAYVTHNYVEKLIHANHPDKKIVGYCPKYVNNHQDIYIIGDSEEPSLDITPPNVIAGNLDILNWKNGKVTLKGWAYSIADDEPPDSVSLSLNGKHVCDVEYGSERKDVADYFKMESMSNCGFSCEWDCDESHRGEILEIIFFRKGEIQNKFFAELN